MKRDISAIANKIRKWDFVEGVKTPVKMPSFFGFKEQGLFEGYDLIVITEIGSNDFLLLYHKKLHDIGLDYETLSYYTIGLVSN